ncbi:serine hydrolase domain-containing protein [Streptomyces sp. NPDC002920]
MSLPPLTPSTPSAQGVDANAVHDLLDALETAEAVEPHSLMIVRHGRLVASGWWAPYTPDRLHLLYSLSKSFTSTAVGLAVAEGLVDLDAPVLSYFPELDAEITDPRSRAMLVRHAAAMASGHEEEDTVDRAYALDPGNLVRAFLLLPPDRDPGTVFAYNQCATYALGAIVRRVTGQSLTAYLRPRLFDPLGIGEVAWLTDPPGAELGFSGLHGTTDTIARLGLLYLDEGVWDGERVLPREWVAEATREHIPTSDQPADTDRLDWERGYGFQFWQSRHGYRGDGAYGQFCLVLPEYDAVVAATAAAGDMQAVLTFVWELLLPGFRSAPLSGGEEADTALAERLSRLALPPAPGKPAPSERAGEWQRAVFTPYGGACAAQPGLTGASVAASGDGDGWTLTLVEDGRELALPLGFGGWNVTEEPLPTAVSGGWTDGDTLAVDVAFLETPHRLRVSCSLADHTFTARWATAPLHGGPLRTQCAPRGSGG